VKAIVSIAKKKLKKKEIARWKLVHGSRSMNCNRSDMEGLAFLGDDNVITQG
jgi:hypothetical protein